MFLIYYYYFLPLYKYFIDVFYLLVPFLFRALDYSYYIIVR